MDILVKYIIPIIKISNVQSEIERKNREISDLTERVRLIELEIKNKRANMQKMTKSQSKEQVRIVIKKNVKNSPF